MLDKKISAASKKSPFFQHVDIRPAYWKNKDEPQLDVNQELAFVIVIEAAVILGQLFVILSEAKDLFICERFFGRCTPSE